MGSQSRASIVTQGLSFAGYPGLTTLANGWLNFKLRSWASSWQWPMLRNRLTQVPLNAGQQSILFGQGQSGEARWVHDFVNPLLVYSADYSRKGMVYIKEVNQTPSIWNDETINQPSSNIGLPYQCKIYAVGATPGQWQIFPWLIPDINYLLVINYYFIPNDLATDSSVDNTLPWYPNDETMIKAVEAAALRWMKQYKSADAKDQEVVALHTADKVHFGATQGQNTNIGLDPSTYRSDQTVFWPWPGT